MACMTLTLDQLARAIPVVALGFGVTVAIAGEAHAEGNLSCGGDASAGPYYDPCAEFEGWTEFSLLSGGAIPADGVLVLQGLWQGALPGNETIALTVTTEDVPLAGTIEATDMQGLVIWRPDTAWTPGATYAIAGAASNMGADGDCLQASLPIAGEVTIEAEVGQPLVPVDIDAMASVDQVPTISLETLACCPGVSPMAYEGGCGGGGYSIDFDPEQCAPFAATGYLQLTLTGTSAAMGSVEQQVLYVLKADEQGSQFAWSPTFATGGLLKPLCAAIDAIDLGTGAVVVGAQECFGEEVADQLGAQVLDPSAQLSCELQVCESLGFEWDLEKCAPYGGGGETPTSGPDDGSSGGTGGTGGEGSSSGESGGQDGDKGCACDGSAGGSPGLLVIVGLAWLARRRRR